jgi:tRNA pseudouridine38-40 synthase
MTRWKLTIEYDGTGYSGWQRQGGGIASVQESVEEAIYAFCQQRVTLHAAGRTDSGVHARGQVAHFDLDYGARPLRGFDLAKAIGAHLRPQPIAILSAEAVPNEFHARFNATSKLYTYRIVNRAADLALGRAFAWHIRARLNADAMNEGAQYLIGHHDFTTFRDSECQAKSAEKTLDALEVAETSLGAAGYELLIHARARSFLHHQVRNMVGTLAMVGDGRWKPADVADALAAKDRARGGPTAPPEGLTLVSVDY